MILATATLLLVSGLSYGWSRIIMERDWYALKAKERVVRVLWFWAMPWLGLALFSTLGQ